MTTDDKTAEPRYFVKKESGSRWARVMDRHSGFAVKRFDILKGEGKANGWDRAKAMCAHLNDRAAASGAAQGDDHGM